MREAQKQNKVDHNKDMITITIKGWKKDHWMTINHNLSINNLVTSIQNDIGWQPDLILNHNKLVGTQIINTQIKDGDNIELGRIGEYDKDKRKEYELGNMKESFNYKAAIGEEE